MTGADNRAEQSPRALPDPTVLQPQLSCLDLKQDKAITGQSAVPHPRVSWDNKPLILPIAQDGLGDTFCQDR